MEQAVTLINEGLAGLNDEDEADFEQQLKRLVAWATEIIGDESTDDIDAGQTTDGSATGEATLAEATVTTIDSRSHAFDPRLSGVCG